MKKLSLNKLKIAKLNNSGQILGGTAGDTTGGTQTDTLGSDVPKCKETSKVIGTNH